MCEYTTWTKCRIFSVKAGVYIVTTGLKGLRIFHGWELMHPESLSVYGCIESGQQSDSGQVRGNGMLLK